MDKYKRAFSESIFVDKEKAGDQPLDRLFKCMLTYVFRSA